jgi:hypothetical protein
MNTTYIPFQFEVLDEIPWLTYQFAGIGSRKITQEGKQAIADTLQLDFNNKRL